VAHIDLKLDNLLLGEDYKLKVADFDLAYIKGDKALRGKGTCNYRAPELKDKTCCIPKATDIYSAGIILFAFKTGGYPYLEDCHIEGHNLYQMMLTQDKKFWDAHEKIQKKKLKFEDSFRELFFSMVKSAPEQRISIAQIKQSAWYNGPIYTNEEVVKKLLEFKVQVVDCKRK